MNLGADIIVAPGGMFSSSTTQQAPLGAKAVSFGRVFRYIKAGAVALVPGNCIQSPGQVTTNDQLTPAAAAVGATSITVTLDGTNNVAADQYKDGLAIIDTTPGEGYAYPITGHAAIALSTAGVFYLGLPIQVALTTDSRVTLCPCPWRGVVQHPVTTATGTALGGAIFPVAATEFGWIQSAGPGAGLIADTPAVGQPVTSVGAVAGALTVHSAELNAVATMMVTGVNTKILPVFWLID